MSKTSKTGRRGRGEGTIGRRKDGRWYASVSLGSGPNGKRQRKTVYGTTRKEVADRLKRLLAEQQDGLPVVPDRQTMERFLTDWLASVQRSVRPKTHDTYAAHVRAYLIPEIGRHKLGQLTAQHVDQMLQRLSTRHAAGTVRNTRAILMRALEQAVKWQLVPRNVAALTDAPKMERRSYTFLSPDEARRFLDAARGDRWEALYTAALAIGLRNGEARGLRWKDVDLERGVLRVTHTLQRTGGKLQLSPLKTKAARRELRLPEVATQALRAHKVRQWEDKLLAGSDWQDMDLVFTTHIGTGIEHSIVLAHLHAILERAGLPHIRLHDLRHSCASLLLAQNVHPKVVQGILGHATVTMTLDTYSHVLPESMTEAAGKLDDVLREAN